MTRPAKATDFLSKMKLEEQAHEGPAVQAAATAEAPKTERAGGTRAGLKHVGAYLDRDTVEKVALLRARLALDNSQLVKLAVERLYAAEAARRKFGEA